MSRSIKCPVCGSRKHFLCAAGEHVQMVVRRQSARHLVDELAEGDLLVLFRKHAVDYPIAPHKTQKVLDPFLADFSAELGAVQIIPASLLPVEHAEVLLIGCGPVDEMFDNLNAEGAPPAVRAACLAFDDAISEASRVRAKRVLVDASNILDQTGALLAAALHCRLTLAEADGVLPVLQEVVIFAGGNLGKRLEADSHSESPICPHCPFASQCVRSTAG